MSSTNATLTAGPSLRAMARIETIRLAKNPFFILSNLIAFGLLAFFLIHGESKKYAVQDLLSWPVVPAFFIGLTTLVVMARQTRSTEAAAEAMSASPGSEARRTQALILACLLPAALGALWVSVEVVVYAIRDVAAEEWWFHTAGDVEITAMLLCAAPIACLGGGLLGVLVGRWLNFPGASAVMVVVLVVGNFLGQMGFAEDGTPVLRLWTPWILWHSGTVDDSTSSLYGGNAVFSAVYLLCLCAAAAIFAIRHDRTARTPRLRQAFIGVVVVGLAALTLSMTTGETENRVSEPSSLRG